MRKLQHTLIFAGLVAACLMAGCKKENPSQGTSFTAETEQGEANAKTGLVGSNIVWRSGDQIQLKNSSSPSQTETLTVAEGTGTNKGKFYTSSSFNLDPPYTATYGVNINTGAVSLPATQTLTAEQVTSTQSNPQGTIADGLMPMVATSSTNKLPFKNLLGGLCFKLTGSGNLTSIKITSSNTSEKLWGDFTANFADGTMAPTTGGAGTNVLTVNCTDITLSSTPQYFVVMLPPGSLASNYTVDFTCNGAVISKPATGDANLVQRSKIKTSSTATNVVPVVQYTVTTAVNNASWGTVSGGGTYQQNATCTVTATPASGYILESWTMNGRDVTWNRSYSLTVNSNVTLTANFVQVPTGALPGLFLVAGSMNNNPRRVWFSRGNLKYSGGDNGTWSFHTNQYDRVGDNGQYNYSNFDGERDIFAWGMNGRQHRGYYSQYRPYHDGNTNTNNNRRYPKACWAYVNPDNSSVYSYNLNDSDGSADWGYNAISNGGNTVNSGWRTLTKDEWQYLINNHTHFNSTVNGVWGHVFRPYGNTQSISGTYTAQQWAAEEANGTLFLPGAGMRWFGNNPPSMSGSNYNRYFTAIPRRGFYPGLDGDPHGLYWTATIADWSNAWVFHYSTGGITTGESYLRNDGMCVRLVKNK